MNIYKSLNETIKYIEDNLTNDISYKKIAKIFGTSESTMQRVFSLITGMSLSEYIRKRKLTVSVNDIRNGEKIIDVAIKYGYSSEISFARAFKKMHNILPSKVKSNEVLLNMQLILKFDETKCNNNISYRIENKNKIILYGIKKEINSYNIPEEAESFWKKIKFDISEFKTSKLRYGVIINNNSKTYYCCALNKKMDNLEKIEIPKSKWFILKCSSTKGSNIKKMIKNAYNEYIPSINYDIKSTYCIEKYNDNETEIYIMIN